MPAWVLKLETMAEDIKYVSDDECWRLTPEGGWEGSDDDENEAAKPVKRGARKKKGLGILCC